MDGGLAELIQNSASRIDTAIGDAVRTIIGKVEQDQLELLLSRTRNLSALIGMRRPDQALQYAWTLRESVDYAHNRLREEKLQWLGPYLAGNSIFLATLQYAGEHHQREVERFEQAVLDAKYRILDRSVPEMVVRGQRIPWPEISAFLRGADTSGLGAVLQLLAPVSPAPSTTGGEIAAAGDADRVLALAAKHFEASSKIFVHPHIPDAKRNGAEKKLTTLADPGDELLVLIDITVFGGAKDGIAIFPSYLTHADISLDPIRLEYRDLPATIASTGSKVIVGDQKMKMYDAAIASSVAAFLRDVRSLEQDR